MSVLFEQLMDALAGVPDLPGAACRGEYDLFESGDPYDVEDATAICARCPTLTACERWYAALPARQRPVDCVVAGEWRPAPRQKKRNEHVA